MSIVTRPPRVLIGDGTAVPTTFATIATGDIAILKRDMTPLVAGNTISDTSEIFIVQGTATGPYFSSPIKGQSIRRFTGASFAPGSKQTVSIGYDRITTQTINVLNNTEYSLDIVLKDEKDLYSHRQLRKMYFYTSTSSATATAIAEGLARQIQLDINNSGELLPLQVIVVGDGSGGSSTVTIDGVAVKIHNMTAPTNVGIQISGTEYTFSLLKGYQKVFFEVGLNSGFDSTVVVGATQNMALGNGTYEQVSVQEDWGLFYFGFTNRRLFPVANPTRYVSSTPTAVAISQTASTVSGDDEVTFSAAPAITAGSVVNIATLAEKMEIKFFKSATVAVMTAAASATVNTQAVTRDEFYDEYTIEHQDDSASGNINGQTVAAPVRTIVCIPPSSSQGLGFEALINPWMASTPNAFSGVTL